MSKFKSLYEYQLEGKSGASSSGNSSSNGVYKSCCGSKARSWTSAEDSRSALAGEHLNGPGHLSLRLYLHFIVWSGIRNLYFEELRVFQACACGEYISME